MYSLDATIVKLKAEGFKLTPQRISVIKYMVGNKDHPTARDIFKALKKKYSGLAFSTVYNTLRMLHRIDEVTVVNIAEEHLNYDPDTSPHFHLLCDTCGQIVDISVDDSMKDFLNKNLIDGHNVKSYQLNLNGTCRDCLAV